MSAPPATSGQSGNNVHGDASKSAPPPPGHAGGPLRHARDLLREVAATALSLYKVMIPVIILVKILQELELIRYAALPLAPVMSLTGLPEAFGVVWATAMLVNLYSAMVVYVSLLPDLAAPVTTAQITVLAAMMLVAHNLPLELRIAQQCGASIRSQLAIRLLGAVALGVILHLIFSTFALYQEPSRLAWTPPATDGSLAAWTWTQARGLAALFFVILGLTVAMRILRALRITDLFNYLLKPFLRLMGIGANAATITVIGLTLGIAYGGGLIIQEVRAGNVNERDAFSALSLMGLSHALVEDTLLMALLGAHPVGAFWARLLFSLALMAVLTRLLFRRGPS